MKCFRSCSSKFIETKGVYIRKVFNSHRIGLVQQHDKRKFLPKKSVQLPQDWFGKTTWPLELLTACGSCRKFVENLAIS